MNNTTHIPVNTTEIQVIYSGEAPVFKLNGGKDACAKMEGQHVVIATVTPKGVTSIKCKHCDSFVNLYNAQAVMLDKTIPLEWDGVVMDSFCKNVPVGVLQ